MGGSSERCDRGRSAEPKLVYPRAPTSRVLSRSRQSSQGVQIAGSARFQNRRQSNGRHWIRTSDFHRVRMFLTPAEKPRNLMAGLTLSGRLPFRKGFRSVSWIREEYR